MAKSAFKKKIFRKEYIPITMAILVLILLVVALVITIINKPKKKDSGDVADANPSMLHLDELNTPTNSCSGDEYNKILEAANNIYVTYEVDDHVLIGTIEDPELEDGVEKEQYGYGLRVTIHNIPHGLSVDVYDDQLGDNYLFINENENEYYEYFDGEILYQDNTYLRVVNVSISSELENCKSVIRNFRFTLPRWNEVSKYEICEQEDYKNTDLCKPFVFTKYDFKGDMSKAQKAVEENKKKEEKEKKDKETKNYVMIIAIAVVVVALIVAVVILMKGRRK